MTQRCRSCGAPIVWATAETTGRAMPIDAAPVESGNVSLIVDLFGATLARVGPRGSGDHVSHFTTCPQAKGWRR